MLHLTINGKPVEVPEGSTIMEAAEAAGVKVPSLCHMKNVHQYGSCRICVVEVEGMKNLQASCMVKAREGMKVKTHSPQGAGRQKGPLRAAFIQPPQGLFELQPQPELRTPGAGL